MKCPHCGAEIQENARFCLYCMKSLEEKTQLKPIKKSKIKWLIVVEIAIAIVLIAGVIFTLCKPKEKKPYVQASETTAESEQMTQQSEDPTESTSESLAETGGQAQQTLAKPK